jgi:DNA-directed RNA polymerase subunit H (RpoH/RPB5)
MKRTVVLSVLLMLIVTNAKAGPPDPIRETILARAHESNKGIIVAVTERGEVAAETAWLLSAQVIRNDSYVPFLLVLKPEERVSVLKALKLSDATLPTLIYYDRHGREISRIVGALPTSSIKQARNSNNSMLN